MTPGAHAIGESLAFAAGLGERGLALALDCVLAIVVRRSGLAGYAAGASVLGSRSRSVGLRGSTARYQQYQGKKCKLHVWLYFRKVPFLVG